MLSAEITMGAVHERNAVFFPNTEALVFEDRRLTYGDLFARCNRLAAALHEAGLRRQDRVAIYSGNCSEYFELYLACHIAGFIAAPVNFRFAVPEIAHVLGDSAPKALLFQAGYAEAVDSLRPRFPDLRTYICIGDGAAGGAPSWSIGYEAFLRSAQRSDAPFRARPEDYTHILYTSGTTGRPKGVLHTQRAVRAIAGTGAQVSNIDGASRVLQATPLFHAGGISYPYAALWMGGSIVLLRAFDPALVMQTIARERVTFTFMVAAMIQAVMNLPDFRSYDLSSIRTVVSAAAPIPLPLLREAIGAFGPVFQVQYGATEFFSGCCLPSHLVRPTGTPDDIRRLASVGHPVPGVDLRIVDEKGDDCATGQTGEVLFRTDGALAGYWNNHAATVEALRDGWYHTGDLGLMDAEGYVFLVDRKKDMIISGGENIYSREVEEAIHQHPEVAESAVVGVPDTKWGETVLAFVVRKPGATVTEQGIVVHCQALIARYKCPRHVRFIDEMPRITTGKIDKVALRRQAAAGTAG
jgi:acyl-CoA synthetase (AMP-forming)/AMP-acid ligase II